MKHLAPVVVLVALGSVYQSANANIAGLNQSAQRKPGTGTGAISGVVVDGRQTPVRAQVLAFSLRTAVPQVQQGQVVPFSTRASGATSTNAEGRFEISGLEPGDYLVAAHPVGFLSSGASREKPIYATTFYPSTIDHQAAERVTVTSSDAAGIRIDLVRVGGARVAGSVVSQAGRVTGGMDVRLFYRFGGFGSECPVAVVEADGTFEIPGIPPGWYRLTIASRQDASTAERTELATTLIEVRDKDVDGLVLTVGPAWSISGRFVAEPGAQVESALGLWVNASPTGEQYAASTTIPATVASDRSFHMTGLLSGSYRFTAGAKRPRLKPTRFTVDGVEIASDSGVELTQGKHELVVFVAPHVPPAPTVDKTLSSAALVEQFKNERVSWRQFDIAKEIVARKDSTVLPSLTAWLSHEERRLRGNAAFIFGALGDPRGFQVITDILTDQSDRPRNDGEVAGKWTLQAQIRSDRYYAAHLLGDLRDPRAIPILVSLLKDEDVNYIVPWALGEIGDKSAVGPLLEVLDEDDPSMRVLAIYALETLNAKEALPRLTSLLEDHRKSNFGGQVSVAEAAKAAIAKLQ